jgi:hypothetical protein
MQEGGGPLGENRDDSQAEFSAALGKWEDFQVAAPEEAGIWDPKG